MDKSRDDWGLGNFADFISSGFGPGVFGFGWVGAAIVTAGAVTCSNRAK